MSRRVLIERMLRARQGRQPAPPPGPGVGGRSRLGRKAVRSGLSKAERWGGVVAYGLAMVFALTGNATGLVVLLLTFVIWAMLTMVVLLAFRDEGRDEVFRRVNDDGGSSGS